MACRVYAFYPLERSPPITNIFFSIMPPRKPTTTTKTSRPRSKPSQPSLQEIEDRLINILHEKTTRIDDSGKNVISDTTSVKLNLQQMFAIVGSIIVGVAVSTAYWTKQESNYDNTLKAHDSRITNVENSLKDMEAVKLTVNKMQGQLEGLTQAVTEQKVALDQQKLTLEQQKLSLQYIADNVKSLTKR